MINLIDNRKVEVDDDFKEALDYFLRKSLVKGDFQVNCLIQMNRSFLVDLLEYLNIPDKDLDISLIDLLAARDICGTLYASLIDVRSNRKLENSDHRTKLDSLITATRGLFNDLQYFLNELKVKFRYELAESYYRGDKSISPLYLFSPNFYVH